MTILVAVAPVIIMLATVGALFALRLFRSRLGIHWLVAAAGSLLALGAVFWQRTLIPDSIRIVYWQPETIFSTSPLLVFDPLAWSYALALVSLCLAVILTDVTEPDRIVWSEWAGTLFLTGLGIFAVLAGNPLTLMLAWAAIDLAEMALMMSQFSERAARERVVAGFAVRIAGLGLLAWAVVLAASSSDVLSYESIPSDIRPYLLLASALRLGVIPLHRSDLADIHERKSLGSMSRLVAAGTGVILIVRVAENGGLDQNLVNPGLVIAMIAGVYAAIAWLQARDELVGRPAWVLGNSSLITAAAILGSPQAAGASGLTMLLSGGVLFLYATRRSALLILPGLGLLSLAGLPYSPGWGGISLYGEGNAFILVPFLLIQAIFCVGYIRHAMRPESRGEGLERWIWAVYPLGLAILPVVHAVIFWLGAKPALGLSTIWPSVVVMALIAAWFGLPRIGALSGSFHRLKLPAIEASVPTIGMNWFYRGSGVLLKLIGRGLDLLTQLMEGEGGVLWALLILVLLMALIIQLNPAGGGL